MAQRNDNTKQKEYAMIQKSTYMAPRTEQIEVRIESVILNLSEGNGPASASAMNTDNTTFGSWD